MDEGTQDPKEGLLLQGRYRVLKKLGEGGMGAVYEAHHELIGKRLALKCLHPQFMSNKEVVERFYREANAATAVGNEHIIEVSDVGKFDDGSPYIIMEFLEGLEFGKLLDDVGSLPIARLVHIVTQVCEALGAAHARGIVHRDMKPENVYLVKRGHDTDFVKVLDFGISKMKESNESLGGGSLTKTGTALGTPYYMPPEQAQGLRDVDHRADIYAVGVILYQGLTGRLPFDADSYPALMVKIMTETPTPIGQLRSDVPPELASVVMRAMARDRNQRFQSTAELAEALRPFRELDQAPMMLASTRPTGSDETTPFGWSEPARSTGTEKGPSGRGLWVGGGVGAVVVVGVLVAVLGSRDPAADPDAAMQAAPAPEQPAPAPMQPPPAVPAPTPQAEQPLPVGIAVPPKPTEVQVSIKATPSEARIYIGDVEFPNPMDAWRPRSLDPVRIRVEAPGHKTTEQLAIFDQDRNLDFTLEKGRGVKRLESLPAAGAPSPARPAAEPKPAAAAPVVTVRPSAKPEPAPAPEPEPKAPAEVYKGPSGGIRSEF